ncbi:unnamed protein product [Malus baccata var. baccata]
MEVADRENYLGEGVIEAYSQKSNDIDEQEDHYASASASKSQFRKVTLKARWSDETGMAEVVDKKGTIWRTTGIVRGSKLYFSIEEVLFLIEIGALLLMDDGDISLSLEDMYVKISNGKHGCSWEEFQAYRQLKSLGYIVGRHGVPWSMKIVKSNHESVSSYGCRDNDEAVDLDSEEFSKFRKSSPGDPSFVLCFTRGHPPSKAELEALQRRCGNIPVKVCHVEQGVVSLFSFDKVELPILP